MRDSVRLIIRILRLLALVRTALSREVGGRVGPEFEEEVAQGDATFFGGRVLFRLADG